MVLVKYRPEINSIGDKKNDALQTLWEADTLGGCLLGLKP